MAVKNTGLTDPAARAEFGDKFDSATTYFQDLSTRIASNTGTEKYRWLGSVPPVREWGTGRIAKGVRSEAYDVENLRYELTIEVDRVELADDQTGSIRMRIAEMAQKAAQHKDSEIGRLLINGDQPGFNAYDGKTFFATDHQSGASGVQNNTLDPSAVVATDPTVAEFKTSLKNSIARLLGLKDDQGEPMNMSASGLVVVVPPSMLLTASEAIGATIIDSTTNVLSGIARVISFAYLTDATTYFLLKTDVAVRPLIFQDREPIEFKAIAEGSEEEFMREKYLYGVRARYRMTYGYWQRAMRNTFA